MTDQRQGWILDVEGNAINLDQVRMVRIGTRYAGPKYVETFHVEAHLSGYDTSDALRAILVQNLPDRVSAQHWIASRFWQPEARHDSVRESAATAERFGPTTLRL